MLIIQVIGPFYLQFPPALTFFYFSFPENHNLVFLLTEGLVLRRDLGEVRSLNTFVLACNPTRVTPDLGLSPRPHPRPGQRRVREEPHDEGAERDDVSRPASPSSLTPIPPPCHTHAFPCPYNPRRGEARGEKENGIRREERREGG